MPFSVAKFTVDPDSLLPPGASGLGRFASTASRIAALSVDSGQFVFPGTPGGGYFDTWSTPDFGVILGTDVDVITMSTLFQAPANGTVYIGFGFDDDERAVDLPMPFDGTLVELTADVDAPPGIGTFAYTVRRNAADAAGSPSITLTGATATDTATTSISYTKKQRFCVKLVATNAVPARHKLTARFQAA